MIHALPPQGAHGTLADSVGLRRPDRGLHDLQAFSDEARIEAGGELRISVSDQEPKAREPFGDLTGTLGHPITGGGWW